MNTETKRRITLHVYRDVGNDSRVRNTVLRSLDLPTPAELAAVMRMLGESDNAYESIEPSGEWLVDTRLGISVLYRTYHLQLNTAGEEREVLLYQNQRIEYSRYLLPYMAIHLDNAWDDDEVMRDAIDTLLWRWGVDAGNGFDLNFTTRPDIADDIRAVDAMFSTRGYPHENAVRSIAYDRRINVLVAELSSDPEAKDVAYPIIN